MRRTAAIISAAAETTALCCWLLLFSAGKLHTVTELRGTISVHCAVQMSRNSLKDQDSPNSSKHIWTHIKHTNEAKTTLPAAWSFVQTSGLNLRHVSAAQKPKPQPILLNRPGKSKSLYASAHKGGGGGRGGCDITSYCEHLAKVGRDTTSLYHGI